MSCVLANVVSLREAAEDSRRILTGQIQSHTFVFSLCFRVNLVHTASGNQLCVSVLRRL